MLRNVTCLLIQDEKNYYLTPYTDEREAKEKGKIFFSLDNTLTAITIWPHKDEPSGLDDVKKQLCLKFIELKDKEYALNLRATSTVESLMGQLDETQRAFVDAVMAEFKKTDNKTMAHAGRSFSTDIVQINLKDVAAPQGFVQVDKKHVDKVAFQHACLETLKACVGFPAMKPLNADPTSSEILGKQTLFHPFALQLNNTVNERKAETDVLVAGDVKEFKLKYDALKQSAAQRSSEQFQLPVTDDETKGLYTPIKKGLEEKLSTYGVTASFQIQ